MKFISQCFHSLQDPDELGSQSNQAGFSHFSEAMECKINCGKVNTWAILTDIKFSLHT